jgi:hypothetical protein
MSLSPCEFSGYQFALLKNADGMSRFLNYYSTIWRFGKYLPGLPTISKIAVEMNRSFWYDFVQNRVVFVTIL